MSKEKITFKVWLKKNLATYKNAEGNLIDILDDVLKNPNTTESMSDISMRLTGLGYSQDNKIPLMKIWHQYLEEKNNLEKGTDVKHGSNRLAKGEASKQLHSALKMPPLHHKVDVSGGKFDITKSEVSLWLMQQPDIMQYVFTRIKNSGLIVYDSEAGTWQGKDYKEVKFREGEF